MADPIRVLHVLNGMDMAGTETLLMNIYRTIDRSKVQFDFAVCVTKKCDYDDEIISLGGNIYHYPRYRIYNHISYCRWWFEFFEMHKEYGIVHGHIGSTAAIYLSIAKLFGLFTIAHSHNTKANLSPRSIAYSIYSYPTRFIADYFMGCSKEALVDRYGVKIANADNAIILRNAINPDKYLFDLEKRGRIRNEFGINDETLVLGTVGRLSNQKNPFEILAICKQLKQLNIKYRFLWVGSGELESDIKKAIDNYNLNKEIIMCGKRDDVYNILQGMDIFLFPSLWEGLGIACVEAQAAGLPTLCSDRIPKEADVSNLYYRLPLNATSIWCEHIIDLNKIIQSDKYKRVNNNSFISEAGYSIDIVTYNLESFYLNHCPKIF